MVEEADERRIVKVLVTRRLPGKALDELVRKHEVTIYSRDRIMPRRELLRWVKGVDGLLSMLTDTIDAAVLRAAGPSLKVITNYAVGFNNIDVKEAKKRGILVTNTPGLLDDAVAEHTITLLLSLSRRIIEADDYVRKGKFKGWSPTLFLGTDITGKTLGIVGLGTIGLAVAKIGMCLGMKVIYFSRGRSHQLESYGGVPRSFNRLLQEADFISLHVPLTKATHHLIGRKELRLMKPTAYLINTARGPVIDEKTLVEFLQKRQIAGAALDVFEREPRLTAGLARLSNVVLTPHIGSATKGAREKMTGMAVDNLLAGLAGKTPANLVSFT